MRGSSARSPPGRDARPAAVYVELRAGGGGRVCYKVPACLCERTESTSVLWLLLVAGESCQRVFA